MLHFYKTHVHNVSKSTAFLTYVCYVFFAAMISLTDMTMHQLHEVSDAQPEIFNRGELPSFVVSGVKITN